MNVAERVMRFGRERELVGVLTEPPANHDAPACAAVILCAVSCRDPACRDRCIVNAAEVEGLGALLDSGALFSGGSTGSNCAETCGLGEDWSCANGYSYGGHDPSEPFVGSLTRCPQLTAWLNPARRTRRSRFTEVAARGSATRVTWSSMSLR